MTEAREDRTEATDASLKEVISGDVGISAQSRTKYLGALHNAVLDSGAGTLARFLTEPARYQRALLRARRGAATSTFRDVATAACAVFRRHTEFACGHKEAHARWKAHMLVLAKAVSEERKDNVASEKEIEGMIPIEELKRAEAGLGHATAGESEDKVMLAFAAYVPAKRADLGACEVVRSESQAKGSGNFVIVPERGAGELILNRYKTARCYGSHRETLPAYVTDVIRESVRAWPRKWMLSIKIGPTKGGPLTNVAYGARYTAVLKRLTGRHTTLNMNRHVHVNAVANATRVTIREAEEVASKMMHSLAQQRTYARVME
jgi:hypothetical protein